MEEIAGLIITRIPRASGCWVFGLMLLLRVKLTLLSSGPIMVGKKREENKAKDSRSGRVSSVAGPLPGKVDT
jgi:hypothetical protein